MKYLLLLALSLVGCSTNQVFGRKVEPIVAHRKSMPGATIPMKCRWENYDGGSCVFASSETVLSVYGKDKQAKYMRAKYSGGFDEPNIPPIWQKMGYKTRGTSSGDMQFLEWAAKTGRPTIISYHGNHCVTFKGMDKNWVVLINNNHVERPEYIPRREFERNWKGYGGNAWTITNLPAPPPKPYSPMIALNKNPKPQF